MKKSLIFSMLFIILVVSKVFTSQESPGFDILLETNSATYIEDTWINDLGSQGNTNFSTNSDVRFEEVWDGSIYHQSIQTFVIDYPKLIQDNNIALHLINDVSASIGIWMDYINAAIVNGNFLIFDETIDTTTLTFNNAPTWREIQSNQIGINTSNFWLRINSSNTNFHEVVSNMIYGITDINYGLSWQGDNTRIAYGQSMENTNHPVAMVEIALVSNVTLSHAFVSSDQLELELYGDTKWTGTDFKFQGVYAGQTISFGSSVTNVRNIGMATESAIITCDLPSSLQNKSFFLEVEQVGMDLVGQDAWDRKWTDVTGINSTIIIREIQKAGAGIIPSSTRYQANANILVSTDILYGIDRAWNIPKFRPFGWDWQQEDGSIFGFLIRYGGFGNKSGVGVSSLNGITAYDYAILKGWDVSDQE